MVAHGLTAFGLVLIPKGPEIPLATTLGLFSHYAFDEYADRHSIGAYGSCLRKKDLSNLSESPCNFMEDELFIMQAEWVERRERFAASIRSRFVADHYNPQA